MHNGLGSAALLRPQVMHRQKIGGDLWTQGIKAGLCLCKKGVQPNGKTGEVNAIMRRGCWWKFSCKCDARPACTTALAPHRPLRPQVCMRRKNLGGGDLWTQGIKETAPSVAGVVSAAD